MPETDLTKPNSDQSSAASRSLASARTDIASEEIQKKLALLYSQIKANSKVISNFTKYFSLQEDGDIAFLYDKLSEKTAIISQQVENGKEVIYRLYFKVKRTTKKKQNETATSEVKIVDEDVANKDELDQLLKDLQTYLDRCFLRSEQGKKLYQSYSQFEKINDDRKIIIRNTTGTIGNTFLSKDGTIEKTSRSKTKSASKTSDKQQSTLEEKKDEPKTIQSNVPNKSTSEEDSSKIKSESNEEGSKSKSSDQKFLLSISNEESDESSTEQTDPNYTGTPYAAHKLHDGRYDAELYNLAYALCQKNAPKKKDWEVRLSTERQIVLREMFEVVEASYNYNTCPDENGKVIKLPSENPQEISYKYNVTLSDNQNLPAEDLRVTKDEKNYFVKINDYDYIPNPSPPPNLQREQQISILRQRSEEAIKDYLAATKHNEQHNSTNNVAIFQKAKKRFLEVDANLENLTPFSKTSTTSNLRAIRNLQGMSEELKDSLEALKIRTISFIGLYESLWKTLLNVHEYVDITKKNEEGKIKFEFSIDLQKDEKPNANLFNAQNDPQLEKKESFKVLIDDNYNFFINNENIASLDDKSLRRKVGIINRIRNHLNNRKIISLPDSPVHETGQKPLQSVLSIDGFFVSPQQQSLEPSILNHTLNSNSPSSEKSSTKINPQSEEENSISDGSCKSEFPPQEENSILIATNHNVESSNLEQFEYVLGPIKRSINIITKDHNAGSENLSESIFSKPNAPLETEPTSFRSKLTSPVGGNDTKENTAIPTLSPTSITYSNLFVKSQIIEIIDDYISKKIPHNPQIIDSFNQAIKDNKPEPTTPYKGMGIKSTIVKKGAQIGIRIDMVASAYLKRFYQKNNTDFEPMPNPNGLKGKFITSVTIGGSEKPINEFFAEKELDDADALKELAAAFHNSDQVLFGCKNDLSDKEELRYGCINNVFLAESAFNIHPYSAKRDGLDILGEKFMDEATAHLNTSARAFGA